MHLRFKRHVRFLQTDGAVRAVDTLDHGVELPAGEVFDVTLDAIGRGAEEGTVRQRLTAAFQGDSALSEALLRRLFDTGLVEHYDPAEGAFARYDRQMLFYDALSPVTDHADSVSRQRRLAEAHVLVLGLGGIGHQVALSLAAAGVGSLTLADGDVVEASNLHRQILFAASDVGRPKVEAARDGLLRIAPGCQVRTRPVMVDSSEAWTAFVTDIPPVNHVMISADRPVRLVNWISDARIRYGYHLIKCGYMNAQGLIGPLLGPDTKGYEELYGSWAPLIDAQPEAIRRFNEDAIAPTMAASNAIMANIAALELVKHITGAGDLTLLGQRMLLDLRNYTTSIG